MEFVPREIVMMDYARSENKSVWMDSNGLQSMSVSDKVESINDKPSVDAEGLLEQKPDLRKSENNDIGNLIITETPNLYKHNGVSMSENIFLKLNRCEATLWLMENHPTAYLLLNLVALRAQRNPGHPSGLKVGEALIGDYESIGTTRRKYRTALDVLVRMKYLTICETCRTRQKSTTGVTTKGTRVKLLSSDIWDINANVSDHRRDHRPATDRPPTDHEQERQESKEYNNTKKENVCVFSKKIYEFIKEDPRLTNEEKIELSENFDEAVVSDAYLVVSGYKEITTTFFKALRAACRGKYKRPEINPKVQKELENEIIDLFAFCNPKKQDNFLILASGEKIDLRQDIKILREKKLELWEKADKASRIDQNRMR
jgi:hypothetical protein